MTQSPADPGPILRTVADPAPSVSEVDAPPDVALIYTDIRDTLGMPFVNLIWRRLGASYAALEWTWDTMKPLYRHGAIYPEAAALRDEQDLPPVPRLPVASLRAVGVDATAERGVRAALAGYARGNPLNLVAFSAVLSRLQTGREAVAAEADSDIASPSEDRSDGAAGNLVPAPRMLSFDQMDETTADMVRAVNLVGARGIGTTIQVSLPRNLAHWPGFLSLYLAGLQPLHDDGRLFTAIDAVLADGHRRGDRLRARLGDTASAPTDVAATARSVIETVVPHAMGRMIPVVSLLQRMLPD